MKIDFFACMHECTGTMQLPTNMPNRVYDKILIWTKLAQVKLW